jgi:pyridoxal 5'-phosphate synthase pdxT subunit
MATIGVLALQGDFAEHAQMLRRVGAEPVGVRKPEHLAGLHGLIIPGGESTTIGRLATSVGLMEPLREFVETHPAWGTCAGTIFLAKHIQGQAPYLGLMDIGVERNAFGRQLDSFIQTLDVSTIGPYQAVFIRAPVIQETGPAVEVLARLDDGRIVAARQGHLLATAFHPELTTDPRLHAYFVDRIVVANQ